MFKLSGIPFYAHNRDKTPAEIQDENPADFGKYQLRAVKDYYTQMRSDGLRLFDEFGSPREALKSNRPLSDKQIVNITFSMRIGMKYLAHYLTQDYIAPRYAYLDNENEKDKELVKSSMCVIAADVVRLESHLTSSNATQPIQIDEQVQQHSSETVLSSRKRTHPSTDAAPSKKRPRIEASTVPSSRYGIIPSSDLALLNSVKDLLKNNLKLIVFVGKLDKLPLEAKEEN